MKTDKVRIFTFAFLILFLELSLIRFLPAQIACLGYYSNFILLASFVGISFGILMASKSIDLLKYFPWALLLLIYMTTKLTFSILPDQNGEIRFYHMIPGKQLSEMIIIPIIFCLTSLVFSCISQSLGRLFNSMPSLEAYKWDILGSLAGITVFTLMSFLHFSPIAWFGLFALTFLTSIWDGTKSFYFSACAFLVILLILNSSIENTHWSPYQKVVVVPEYSNQNLITGHHLFVNNIYHQTVVNDISRKEFFYKIPYEAFTNNNYKNALIIGAGTGNDVALALANNVDSIDAVEIDPVIKSFGDKLNPYKPYENSKVMIYVTDGRSYLQKTNKKYDLIIYALTDSLVLSGNHSGVRLESFLYTKDSFKSAKDHLTPNGLFVLYNNYRQPWLVQRLFKMLTSVFEKETYLLNTQWNSAILMNGNKLNELKPDIQRSSLIPGSIKESTDDWPFTYLYEPHIPMIYLKMFLVLALIVYFSMSWILSKPVYKIINPTYFFLGAAFLLLETRSVVLFSLFFGTTWIVNSLVFFAILLMVFIAINFVSRLNKINLNIWYILLGISLLVQYLFPMQQLLLFPLAAKYFFVSVLTLSPVFFANVIFSGLFKDSDSNSINFASNILGAALGGMAEYLALLVGYRNLIIVIMMCYVLAFMYAKKPILKS